MSEYRDLKDLKEESGLRGAAGEEAEKQLPRKPEEHRRRRRSEAPEEEQSRTAAPEEGDVKTYSPSAALEEEDDVKTYSPRAAEEEPAEAEPLTAAGPEEPVKTEALPTAAEEVTQRADSRVPLEARRMSAAPYGAEGAAHRRPGTRPMTAFRRPAQETRSIPPVRRSAPAAAQQDPDRTRSFNPASVAEPQGSRRVSVGYAPGRMSMPPRNLPEFGTARMAQDSGRNARMGQDSGRNLRMGPDSGRNPRMGQDSGRNARTLGGRNMNPRTAQDYVRDIRNAQEYGRDPRDPRRTETGPRPAVRARRHPVQWAVAALLVLVGLVLAVIAGLPEDNPLREGIGKIAGTVVSPVERLFSKTNPDAEKILAFSVTGNERTTAPADVIFSVTTGSAVKELRLTDEDGNDLNAVPALAENSDGNYWTLTFRVKDGYEGLVKLQTRPDGSEEWKDTEYTAALAIAPPLAAAAATQEPAPTEEPEKTLEEYPEETPEAVPENAAEEPAAEGSEETEEPGEAETAGGEPEGEGTGEESEDYGDSMWGTAWGEASTAAVRQVTTPEPTLTPTPEPTPEPTPTPALVAEADPAVGNSLILTTTVYEGSKKIKNYVRPAKALIHMPAGDDYTARKIGVLTFRGNAFRQNAAVGEVAAAGDLSLLWKVEAGSLRGASQYFYGYEWTGQPAIVKWSTQVREGSNMDEEKKKKAALREVIIAGSDGVIRFLDLEDGVETRNAVTMGYPMRGTPSLHSAGYPYMNVGQYTRKLKNKTGSIGLRQYNLYTQKEMKLIDGLDGKLHRGLNRIGSFETSALIDRSSDTVVTLGTSGLLYLIRLNTAFDYQAATLSTNMETVVMASRAKGEKKNELVAVESSHAMYDRYVFYADMGGILRCVDTNFLTTVWAAETGDSVMSAVALDLSGENKLDLYTANMLSLRKKGNAQIRKYNALSGTELWTVEIGVAKNTKTKEDVGVKASPVIGQKGLKDLVFYTVTGLNAEGRQTLGCGEDAKAALVALEKETGRIRWARELSDRSESSPVAVYDTEGNGSIIQCAEDGKVILLDGLTGEVKAELQVEGKILASPAVYNDIMVVGTSGKGTESVVGIRIR